MGLLSGNDDVNIQVKMQGAREAAAEGKMVKESVEGIGDATTKTGIASEKSSKKVSLARKGFAALAVAAKYAAFAVGAAAVAFTYKGIRSAVDLGEQINKTAVVFGKSSRKVLNFSEDTATSLGISKREALEYAGVFGNMLVPMGITEKKAASMSTGLVQLAADMASFNNANPEEVLEALRAGLAGETEPLRRFGVFLSADRVALEAKKKGLSENYQELTAGQKALVGYNIILRDTKKAHGDFARTSTSLANQERILRAEFENLSAKVGAKLLPVLTDVAKWLSKVLHETERGKGPIAALGNVVKRVVGHFKDHTTEAKALGAAIGVITAFVLTYKVALFAVGVAQKVAAVATGVWTAAQWLLNAAMTANPIGLVVLAIAGLIAAVVLVVTHFDWFKGKLGGVWAWLKGAVASVIGFVKAHWKLLIGILLGPVGIVAALLITHWKAIKATVTGAVSAVLGFLKSHWRLIVSILLGPVAIVVNQVIAHFGELVGFVKSVPGKLASAGKGMFNFVKEAFKSAINWVIEKWNSLEFKIPGFDPPGPGPKFGGITIGVPDIPMLAAGGTIVSSGLSLVGEAGPELLRLPKGARVEPLISPTISAGGEVAPVFGEDRRSTGRPLVIQVPVHLDGKVIASGVAEVSEDEQARH